MQINVSTRHGSLSEEQEQYIRDKADRLTNLFERVTSVAVTVNYEASTPRVEILVNAEHKHDFVSHDQNGNLLAAVDTAMHKMEQQLRRYKDRIQDKRGTPSMSGDVPPPGAKERKEA